jgi:membrane associated rhomboid family serine protease
MLFRITPAVKNLIIINTLMLIITWLTNEYYSVDLTNILGLHFFKSENFHIYQYVTYMFMHGGFWHLFFNMYALFMFGIILEQVWGSKRFLIFYFVTGIGAALVHTAVNYTQIIPMIRDAHSFINTPSPELFNAFIRAHISDPNREIFTFINAWSLTPNDPDMINQAIQMVNAHIQMTLNIPTVGASGAVFGVLLAFGMLFPNTQLMLLIPPIPIKAKYFVLLYGGLELFLALQQPGSQIAHFAHLGGMLFGYLMLRYWRYDRNTFYY